MSITIRSKGWPRSSRGDHALERDLTVARELDLETGAAQHERDQRLVVGAVLREQHAAAQWLGRTLGFHGPALRGRLERLEQLDHAHALERPGRDGGAEDAAAARRALDGQVAAEQAARARARS